MPSNCFENALVLCLNFFLVIFGIPLHFFDLELKCIFGCGILSLNSPIISQEIIS